MTTAVIARVPPEVETDPQPDKPIGEMTINALLRRLDKEDLSTSTRLERLSNFVRVNKALIDKRGYDLLADYFEKRMPKG